MKHLFLGAWRYRHFILSSIQSEFRARFARSQLGGLWMVIHPLAQSAIFALVLAEIMAARLPGFVNDKFAYAVYLLSGMLAWSLFSEVVTRCLTLFVDNANLLKKIVFPRITLPLIVAGSALLNNLLLFLAVLLVFAVLGRFPGIQIVWIPPLMLLTLALGLGFGLLLGLMNVFLRDVGQVVPVVLQLGFWFTPIVYTASALPEFLRPIISANPMTPIVQGFQNAMLLDSPPDVSNIGWLALLTMLLLTTALVVFRRASAEIVDAL